MDLKAVSWSGGPPALAAVGWGSTWLRGVGWGGAGAGLRRGGGKSGQSLYMQGGREVQRLQYVVSVRFLPLVRTFLRGSCV